MSIVTEPSPETSESALPETSGLLVSFSSAHEVVNAVRIMRNAGYRRLDVHSPHPIHELEKVIRGGRSWLPYAALTGAVIGLSAGIWMAWWMNAVDYPFIISGKPMFSLLPSLPVAFELAILLAAFGVFGGTILLGGLPRPSNGLFRVPAFARATNDRFFLAIDRRDPLFDETEISDLLSDHGAIRLDSIPRLPSRESRIPRPLILAAVCLSILALIPPVLIAKARYSTSTLPRLSFISDMDHQPKFKAQTTSRLFADGRSMRPQVPGTIARGDLQDNDAYYLGTMPNSESAESVAVVASDGNGPYTQTSLNVSGDSGDADQPVEPRDAAVSRWVTEFPVAVDEALIRRGRERYEIFCAVCHGIGGDGDGLVTLRALELEQGTWVKPTSLHAEPIREQAVGQLYNTISNGVRKMPGYASQISVRDRWAIVSYLRALQKTRTASAQDVPSDILPTMRELN